MACPADVEHISFTNSHWEFTKSQLRDWFDCQQLEVINDFEAVAHGITELGEDDCLQIGGELPSPINLSAFWVQVQAWVWPLVFTATVTMYWIPRAVTPTLPRWTSARWMFSAARKTYQRVSLERVFRGRHSQYL